MHRTSLDLLSLEDVQSRQCRDQALQFLEVDIQTPYAVTMSYPRIFLVALSVQTLVFSSQTILVFSLPLLAYELSQEAGQLALIKGAGFIPNILFAIFVGVINDRLVKTVALKRYAIALCTAVIALLIFQVIDAVSSGVLVAFIILLKRFGLCDGQRQSCVDPVERCT